MTRYESMLNEARAAYEKRFGKKSTPRVLVNGEFIGLVHVTKCSEDQKLEWLCAINTAMINNPVCQARIAKALRENDTTCICLECYAEKHLKYCRNNQGCFLYNQHLLASHELTELEIAPLSVYQGIAVRFEQFGDVSNVQQCVNYIRIAAFHKAQKFGAWSKNGGMWKHAFNQVKKPENLTFIKSSVHLDIVDDVTSEEDYVDSVFTVCSNLETLEKLMKEYNGVRCNGVKCRTCMQCYNHHRKEGEKPLYIFELERK